MPTERIGLIHKIREAIIEPNSVNDGGDLQSRFGESLEGVMKQANLEVSHASMTPEQVIALKDKLTAHFVTVASDLGTFDLAKGHVSRLFTYLLNEGARCEEDLLRMGAIEFYKVSKEILGPLWAAYANEVFSSSDGNGVYLFAARDATPIYWATEGLLSPRFRNNFNIGNSTLVHVDWNRWFMGQEDETEGGVKPLPLTHPLMRSFYSQMGFGGGSTVKIVEPGAWGSAANALKTMMPDQKFELWFMFSHMPDRIYGFLNTQAEGIDPVNFEMINDTAEAVPKAYQRPDTLVIDRNNNVVADLKGKIIDSPYMIVWTWAANQGAYDAGVEFAKGKRVNIRDHVEHIMFLSKCSQQGSWTGVLPRNTLTWTEGEKWKANWKWGEIPPLK